MANYTVNDIKTLREKTGSGMLDVKKALEEAEGDIDKAVEILRVKGLKGITKREGRSATNGIVAARVLADSAVLLEVNCETDFVAKGDKFQALVEQIVEVAVREQVADVDALMAATVQPEVSVARLVEDANATIGEKIVVRRLAWVKGDHIATYLHRTSTDLPPTVGVIFAINGEITDQAKQAAHDVALHIAAMSPTVMSVDDVPAEVVDNERRVAEETARNENKPEKALPKIVEGRVKGYFKENVLVEQPFTKDNKRTVGAVLSQEGVSAAGFARFRVGV